MIRTRLLAAICMGCLLVPALALPRTKLTTLPDRAELVLSLENPNQALLFEERDIPLQGGTNFVDFSWQGVDLDPNSVRIELLSNPGTGGDATRVIATGFPPNENALTWQVYTPEARIERIRVSYLIRGVKQQASYEIRANEEETAGEFRQFFHLQNASGEDLDNAVIRLPLMDDLDRSMDSGETRRFVARQVEELPIEKSYEARPGYRVYQGEDGETIGLVYKLANTEEAGLGESLLPAGKARLFGRYTMQQDGESKESSIFLGEDILGQTPPKEEAELQLGKVKDVLLKRYEMRSEKKNVRRNDSNQIVLFDLERELRYEMENFKSEPVALKIVEPMNGDWSVENISGDGVSWERKSIRELEVFIDLPAAARGQEAEKKEVRLTLLLKNRFSHEN